MSISNRIASEINNNSNIPDDQKELMLQILEVEEKKGGRYKDKYNDILKNYLKGKEQTA